MEEEVEVQSYGPFWLYINNFGKWWGAGVVPIMKRRCLPGGRLQYGEGYLGVLQVSRSF